MHVIKLNGQRETHEVFNDNLFFKTIQISNRLIISHPRLLKQLDQEIKASLPSTGSSSEAKLLRKLTGVISGKFL